MDTFVQRFSGKIKGVINGFDRIVFKGCLRPLMFADGQTGEGTFTFTLTKNQLAKHKAPYLKATWSGAYDALLNGEPVKQVHYNLPDLPAGWYVPASAARTLRVGENTVRVRLVGPGKEQKPGAPFSKEKPFIRLGVINWQ